MLLTDREVNTVFILFETGNFAFNQPLFPTRTVFTESRVADGELPGLIDAHSLAGIFTSGMQLANNYNHDLSSSELTTIATVSAVRSGSQATILSPEIIQKSDIFGFIDQRVREALEFRKILEALDETDGDVNRAIEQTNPESDFDPNNPGPFCFLAGTLIDMWPTDPSIKLDENGLYNEKEVLASVWRRSIEEITPDDWVVSYDEMGNLKPGRVTRTFQNYSKHILDVFGLEVTPGHATYCAEGKFANRHVPIIDILRSDGALMKADGTRIRAATNCKIGSKGDQFIHAIVGEKTGIGKTKPLQRGLIRAGTKVLLDDGETFSLIDRIKEAGGVITEDGYILHPKNGRKMPFHWRYSERLPKPEDYILKRSCVTLEEIYQVDDWEAVGPQIPAPAVDENNPTVKDPKVVNVMPPNIPLGMENRLDGPIMTRKQRRAYEAKQRKERKASKTTAIEA